MSCELIRVDFKRKLVTCRESTDKGPEPYDPRKCPSAQDTIEMAMVLLEDAHEENINPDRMIFIVADAKHNHGAVLFDCDALPIEEAIEDLELVIGKLRAAQKEMEL